jgi:hypothetical protein
MKAIVTTTINSPTKAIKLFDEMKDWTLIVVGDKNTPNNYYLNHGIYVSPEDQINYDKPLSNTIGWNCMQRRNFGILLAYHLGADIVAVVDDDNIPLQGWGENLMIGRGAEVNYYETDLPAFDPVGATNYPMLWHRGFPLQLLSKRKYTQQSKEVICAQVQADFWNGNPDIDAICRMEYAPECRFHPDYFPIASNKISPFNSQNIFLLREVLRNYFLFPGIGRMDDIWASFYVQSKGVQVIYGKPSVYQKRNPHDLIKDMRDEYLGYEHNLELINSLVQNSENIYSFLPEKSIKAFELYRRHFI